MGIKLAVVGVGEWGRTLIPLLKAHPDVEHVALCDVNAAKLEAASAALGITQTYPSLDAVCQSDVDAVAIITQHWLHAPQAVQALRAGKHVFSTVPAGITVDEVETLVRTVEETGKIYMLGETSYYFPSVIYCRQRFAAGDFGDIIYTSADYFHHLDHRLLERFKDRGGDQWRELAVIPPMYYPTHSTSSILSVTGAYMTHVSCQGFVDREGDGVFAPEVNRWRNPFSNQTALFRMSDGSSCLVNVFWRAAHPGAVRLSIYGTKGSLEQYAMGEARWLTVHQGTTPVDDMIRPSRNIGRLKAGHLKPHWARRPKWVKREWIPGSLRPSVGVATEKGTFQETTPIQPVDQLPKEFADLRGVAGEEGSNYFVIAEFIRALVEKKQPANNVWMAARYTVPGIVAHESALRGGELLSVPDFGFAPAGDVSRVAM
jgi:predicted dehydrogenase